MLGVVVLVIMAVVLELGLYRDRNRLLTVNGVIPVSEEYLSAFGYGWETDWHRYGDFRHDV